MIWVSRPVVWVTLSINKFGEKAWSNSVQHRWTHSWKTNMAMPMHRDTAREKVVNSQSLQTVSFVSSIPLRAVHDLDSPEIVTGFVCTLQIPLLVEKGRQMFGFLKGPWLHEFRGGFSFVQCTSSIDNSVRRYNVTEKHSNWLSWKSWIRPNLCV